MNIGVIGLGLIGGSMCKAYNTSHKVFGYDSDETILGYAKISEIIHDDLTDENIGSMDLLIISTYPKGAEAFLKEKASLISQSTVVIDCLGIKTSICKLGFSLAKEFGFTFIGGHPMAGTHNSGIKFSDGDLFAGQPMVLCPPIFDDIELIARAEKLLSPCRFGRFSVTTPEKHDEIIAFTSQLAHVVSNGYVKSKTATEHLGFSAGSYKDLTRVAWLNPEMWADLFLENKNNLLFEIDTIIGSLTEYKEAIEGDNREELVRLLDDGRRKKSEIDGGAKNA